MYGIWEVITNLQDHYRPERIEVNVRADETTLTFQFRWVRWGSGIRKGWNYVFSKMGLEDLSVDRAVHILSRSFDKAREIDKNADPS